MRYHDLLAIGREMTPPQLEMTLKSLLADDRFAAVLGWLDRNREKFVKDCSKPATSDNPGKLAHAAGAVHCVNLLAAQLARLGLPAASGGAQRPEEED